MFHANSFTSGHVRVVRVFSRQSGVNAQPCARQEIWPQECLPDIHGRIHTTSAAGDQAAIETAATARYTVR